MEVAKHVARESEHWDSDSIRGQPVTIDSSTIVRFAKQASGRLPSRGQVAARGSINGHEFQTVLEPDGVNGHWMKVDQELLPAADIGVGDIVSFAIGARGRRVSLLPRCRAGPARCLGSAFAGTLLRKAPSTTEVDGDAPVDPHRPH